MSVYELGSSFNQSHHARDYEADLESFITLCHAHNESIPKLQASIISETLNLAEKCILAEKEYLDELSTLQHDVQTLKQTREELLANNHNAQQHSLQLNERLQQVSALVQDSEKQKKETTEILDGLKNDVTKQQQTLDDVMRESMNRLSESEVGYRLYLQHLGLELRRGDQKDSTLFIFTQIDPLIPETEFFLTVTLHCSNQYNISTKPQLKEQEALQKSLNASDNFTGFLGHVRKLFQEYVANLKSI